MKSKYQNIKSSKGHFSGTRDGNTFSAQFDLFLIKEAWNRGLDLEDEADGYGPGEGIHGDWSGIRDSSEDARNKMLEKSLNFIFTD